MTLIRNPYIRLSWPAWLTLMAATAAWWATRRTATAMWNRRPWSFAAATLAAAATWTVNTHSWHALALATLIAAAALTGWAHAHPTSWHRHTTHRWNTWRRTRPYARHWDDDMHALNLNRGDYLPALLHVTGDNTTETARIRLAPGSIPDDWDAVRTRIAQTWNARTVRIRRVPGEPQLIDLHIRHTGPTETDTDDPTHGHAFPRAPKGPTP